MMEPIYYAVKVVALLWILMVAFIAMFGANRSTKNERFSSIFMATTLSTVLPIRGTSLEETFRRSV